MLKKLENYKYIKLEPSVTQARNLDKWSEALSSGEYKQVKNVLLLPDKVFGCCHGIACAIYSSFPFEWIETSALDCGKSIACLRWFDEDGEETGSELMPPLSWMFRVYGIDSMPAGYLAQLNDNGATFEEIAQLLDERWVPVLSGSVQTRDFLAAARSNG